MRSLIVPLVLLLTLTGCRTIRRCVDVCCPITECETKCATPCPEKVQRPHRAAPPCDVEPPEKIAAPRPKPEAPVCPREEAPCPRPRVEVQAPETIHVKAPQPKVIIETPPPTVIPHAAMQQAYAAPQQAYAVPQAAAYSAVQQVPVGRARLGFAFDTIRIPFPILRPIAVPTVPEVTMQVAQPQMIAQPQFVMPQQQQFVVPQAPPQQFVVPQQAVVQQQAVPVQGHAVVPVQGHAVVPVQGQAMVPVQGQSFVPQGFGQSQQFIAPQAMPQSGQAQSGMDCRMVCTPAGSGNGQSQAQSQAQAAEELARQLEALCRQHSQRLNANPTPER